MPAVRAKATNFLLTGLVASAMTGQTVTTPLLDRIFRFDHTETEQALQEAVTVIRAVADIRDISTNAEHKTLTLRGTTDQVSLAEWLFNELDQPANRALRISQGSDPVPLEYRMPGNVDEVVRVFYLTHAATPQHVQEIATNIRGLTHIPRLFTYNTPKAVVLRGTTVQIKTAAWLIREFDQPANRLKGQGLLIREYRPPDASDSELRVFYLTSPITLPALQEIATVIRGTADIHQLYTHNEPRAVLLRGTRWQVVMADWLVKQLDIPAAQRPDTASEYQSPGKSDEVVRVYYLPSVATPQEFQAIVIRIRAVTGIGRIFSYNPKKALTMRGTAHQIALADRLIADGLMMERAKPDSPNFAR